ncbi:unnamed protein product [Gadus morhua 'NCC']
MQPVPDTKTSPVKTKQDQSRRARVSSNNESTCHAPPMPRPGPGTLLPRATRSAALSAEQMPLAVPGERMSPCQETGVQCSNGQVLAWTTSGEAETTGG